MTNSYDYVQVSHNNLMIFVLKKVLEHVNKLE
jgi:hypothetical protein